LIADGAYIASGVIIDSMNPARSTHWECCWGLVAWQRGMDSRLPDTVRMSNIGYGLDLSRGKERQDEDEHAPSKKCLGATLMLDDGSRAMPFN